MQSLTPHTICGAKKKSTGEPCTARPMPNGRCRMHGGSSLAGTASATFKHGRYSKHLPSHLADRYRAALDDPDMLVMRDELALLDTMIDSVLAKSQQGEIEDGAARGEVAELVGRRVKVAEHERRRLVDLQQMLTVQQAMAFLAAVLDTVRQHVEDRDVLARIAADLGRLADRHGGTGVLTGQ